MTIEGGRINGGEVNSHGDHRIAMAFAVAGLVAKGPIVINDCDNVSQPHSPGLWNWHRQAGMEYRLCLMCPS